MGVRFSRRGEETAVRGRRQGRRKLVVRSTDCGGVSAGRRRPSTSFSPPRGYHWRSSKGRGALSFSGTRPIYSSPFLGKVLIASTSPVVGSPAVGADHFVNCKRPNALPLLHRNLCTLYSVAQSGCLSSQHVSVVVRQCSGRHWFPVKWVPMGPRSKLAVRQIRSHVAESDD